MPTQLYQPPHSQPVEDHESDTENMNFPPEADVRAAGATAPVDVEEDTRLHDAAARDDVAAMEKLLAEGVDINAKCGKYKNTALHVATTEKKKKAIASLLAHGADRTARNSLGLTAAEYGHNKDVAAPAAAKCVAGAAAAIPATPSSYRSAPAQLSWVHEMMLQFDRWGWEDQNLVFLLIPGIVMFFAGWPAANFVSVVVVGLSCLCARGVSYRHKQKFGREEELMFGIRLNHPEHVRNQLKNGANPNGCGRGFPLLQAMEYLESGNEVYRENAKEIISLLLDYKADPNVRNGMGETPLSMAISARNMAVVKRLLDAGATPNVQDKKGRTPLHIATNLSVMKALLDHDADPNARDEKGLTLLARISPHSWVDAITLLIERGADPNVLNAHGQPLLFNSNPGGVQVLLRSPDANPNVQDKEGYTPLHRALMAGNRELSDVLLADPRTDRDLPDKDGHPARAYFSLVYGDEEPPAANLVLESRPEKHMLPDWHEREDDRSLPDPVRYGVVHVARPRQEKPGLRIGFPE